MFFKILFKQNSFLSEKIPFFALVVIYRCFTVKSFKLKLASDKAASLKALELIAQYGPSEAKGQLTYTKNALILWDRTVLSSALQEILVADSDPDVQKWLFTKVYLADKVFKKIVSAYPSNGLSSKDLTDYPVESSWQAAFSLKAVSSDADAFAQFLCFAAVKAFWYNESFLKVMLEDISVQDLQQCLLKVKYYEKRNLRLQLLLKDQVPYFEIIDYLTMLLSCPKSIEEKLWNCFIPDAVVSLSSLKDSLTILEK